MQCGRGDGRFVRQGECVYTRVLRYKAYVERSVFAVVGAKIPAAPTRHDARTRHRTATDLWCVYDDVRPNRIWAGAWAYTPETHKVSHSVRSRSNYADDQRAYDDFGVFSVICGPSKNARFSFALNRRRTKCEQRSRHNSSPPPPFTF